MLETWAERTLATLRPNYPGWDIWVVYAVPRGQTWYARPKGTPIATIHAETPEELITAIANHELELEDDETPALPE